MFQNWSAVQGSVVQQQGLVHLFPVSAKVTTTATTTTTSSPSNTTSVTSSQDAELWLQKILCSVTSIAANDTILKSGVDAASGNSLYHLKVVCTLQCNEPLSHSVVRLIGLPLNWEFEVATTMYEDRSVIESLVFVPAGVQFVQLQFILGSPNSAYHLIVDTGLCEWVPVRHNLQRRWMVQIPEQVVDIPDVADAVISRRFVNPLLQTWICRCVLIHTPEIMLNQMLAFERNCQDMGIQLYRFDPLDPVLYKSESEQITAALKVALADGCNSIWFLRDDTIFRTDWDTQITKHMVPPTTTSVNDWRGIWFGAMTCGSNNTTTISDFESLDSFNIFSTFAFALMKTETLQCAYDLLSSTNGDLSILHLHLLDSFTEPNTFMVWQPNLVVLHPTLSMQMLRCQQMELDPSTTDEEHFLNFDSNDPHFWTYSDYQTQVQKCRFNLGGHRFNQTVHGVAVVGETNTDWTPEALSNLVTFYQSQTVGDIRLHFLCHPAQEAIIQQSLTSIMTQYASHRKQVEFDIQRLTLGSITITAVQQFISTLPFDDFVVMLDPSLNEASLKSEQGWYQHLEKCWKGWYTCRSATTSNASVAILNTTYPNGTDHPWFGMFTNVSSFNHVMVEVVKRQNMLSYELSFSKMGELFLQCIQVNSGNLQVQLLLL